MRLKLTLFLSAVVVFGLVESLPAAKRWSAAGADDAGESSEKSDDVIDRPNNRGEETIGTEPGTDQDGATTDEKAIKIGSGSNVYMIQQVENRRRMSLRNQGNRRSNVRSSSTHINDDDDDYEDGGEVYDRPHTSPRHHVMEEGRRRRYRGPSQRRRYYEGRRRPSYMRRRGGRRDEEDMDEDEGRGGADQVDGGLPYRFGLNQAKIGLSTIGFR